MWKRKLKAVKFLLKQKYFEERSYSRSGSKLGSIWLLKSRKRKHFSYNMGQGCGSGSWKRLNYCGNGNTLKKEAVSGTNSEATKFIRSYGSENKNILLLPHFWNIGDDGVAEKLHGDQQSGHTPRSGPEVKNETSGAKDGAPKVRKDFGLKTPGPWKEG